MLSSTQSWLNPEIWDVNDPGEITQSSEPRCPLWSEKQGPSPLLAPSMPPGQEGSGRARKRPSLAHLLLRDAGPHPTLRAHPHSGAHRALPPPPGEHEVPGHPSWPSHSPRGLVSEYRSRDDGPACWCPLGEKTEGSPALKGVRGPLYFCISKLEKPSRPHMLSYVSHRPGTEKPPSSGTSTPRLHLLCPDSPREKA